MTHHSHPNAVMSRRRQATRRVVGRRAGEVGPPVTAVSSAPPQAATPLPPGPAARRLRPPGWLDLRLVLGVLLVLGSVLLGARVVGAADATVPVWAVAGDLAAGTELTADDLVAVDVRLDDAANAYLSTRTRPEGSTLARAVRAGELLPGSALEEPEDLVQLALPVQAGYVPPGLERGGLVDVYAVADPALGATAGTGGEVTLVVEQATVQALSGRSEGVLSTPTSTVQVVVSVAEGDAQDVLAAIGGRPLVVVLRSTVDGDADRAGRVPARSAIPPTDAGQGAPAPAGPAG
jgi:hypothetical protein